MDEKEHDVWHVVGIIIPSGYITTDEELLKNSTYVHPNQLVNITNSLKGVLINYEHTHSEDIINKMDNINGDVASKFNKAVLQRDNPMIIGTVVDSFFDKNGSLCCTFTIDPVLFEITSEDIQNRRYSLSFVNVYEDNDIKKKLIEVEISIVDDPKREGSDILAIYASEKNYLSYKRKNNNAYYQWNHMMASKATANENPVPDQDPVQASIRELQKPVPDVVATELKNLSPATKENLENDMRAQELLFQDKLAKETQKANELQKKLEAMQAENIQLKKTTDPEQQKLLERTQRAEAFANKIIQRDRDVATDALRRSVKRAREHNESPYGNVSDEDVLKDVFTGDPHRDAHVARAIQVCSKFGSTASDIVQEPKRAMITLDGTSTTIEPAPQAQQQSVGQDIQSQRSKYSSILGF